MSKITFAVLAFFTFTLPWQDTISLPGTGVLSVARIAGLALLVAGFSSLFRYRYQRMAFKVPPLLVLTTTAFTLWAVFSSFWNRYNPNAALFESLIYVQLAVMVWLIWQLCRGEKDHFALLQAFVLGSSVLVGTIMYEFISNPFIPNAQQSIQRYTSLGANPNRVASLIALSLPIAWYISLIREKGFWYWLNLLYIPAALFAIVLTASRGGFVIAAVGLTLIPLTLNSISYYRRMSVAALLLFIGVGITATVPVGNLSRIADTTTELTEGNVSNRSQIWRAGLELYSQSPLLGIGTGSFSRAVKPILGIPISAHNAFITVLTEMGFIGFTLFALNLLIVLGPLLTLRAPHRTFYVILWLALVVSMVPSNVENAQHVWALIALFATRKAYLLAPAKLLSTNHLESGIGAASYRGSYRGLRGSS